MTRASFETQIRGACGRTINNGAEISSVGTGLYASENISGVSRKKPEGFKDPTPYSFRRDRYDSGYGLVEKQDFDGSTVYRGWVGNGSSFGAFSILNCFNNLYTWSDAPASYHQDRALVKARLAMKGSNVNLGVAFAERSQTARLVGDSALSLVRSVTALRHGQWRRAFNALGITAPKRAPKGSNWPQKWLEMQYGWKPLLSDVHGAVAALTQRPTSDWRITGKGSSRGDLKDGPATGRWDGPYESNATGEYHGWEGCSVRIDAVPAENPTLHDLAALGITNPLEIAWELVPYSFVVDWFLPVGNYLSSLDAMLGFGPTSCCITTFKKVNWTLIGKSGSFSGGVVQIKNAAWRAQRERIALIRTVRGDVPLPTLPRFKDPRSFAHMANGLSLLAGAFGRRR